MPFRTTAAGIASCVRPDTYLEANLFPAHRGAAGAPNELVGDWDGRLGSGASGWVVLDAGDATKGFKSYDWWGTIRAYKKAWSPEHQAETFSSIGWDRWILRRLYATGGDAGLFFDLVDKAEPFTVTVEDCVSLGRAFGGGVANILSAPDEPSVFRRCQLWCLDWWGDAAGAYVRAEHPEMPPHPDVLFEDCTLVGPDNACRPATRDTPASPGCSCGTAGSSVSTSPSRRANPAPASSTAPSKAGSCTWTSRTACSWGARCLAPAKAT